ncbi:MAG: radical SAM protein [Bacteroidales bacterium]|nr:radical SAM protein [Bacteroidales bacterium]
MIQFSLSDNERDWLNKLYPLKLTPYLKEQADKSYFIKAQFFPSSNEFNEEIITKEPFKGLLNTENEFIERLYEDRIVLKLTSICPAHCRFCYRRAYVFGQNMNIKDKDVDMALELIRTNSEIRSVLITGGFPILLGVKKLKDILSRIIEEKSISQIYIALGRPIMNPFLITEELAEMIEGLNRLNNHVTIACTVHINHYDELTSEVVNALNILTRKGISLWNQATLLKSINDDEVTLSKLFSELRRINVIPYYLIHAMPLKGASHFRTTIEKGTQLMKYLEQYSGHERPIFIVIPTVGKVQLVGNSKIEHKLINNKKYAILNTPYKADKFMEINNITELPENHVIDKEGFIVAYYLDGTD